MRTNDINRKPESEPRSCYWFAFRFIILEQCCRKRPDQMVVDDHRHQFHLPIRSTNSFSSQSCRRSDAFNGASQFDPSLSFGSSQLFHLSSVSSFPYVYFKCVLRQTPTKQQLMQLPTVFFCLIGGGLVIHYQFIACPQWRNYIS